MTAALIFFMGTLLCPSAWIDPGQMATINSSKGPASPQGPDRRPLGSPNAERTSGAETGARKTHGPAGPIVRRELLILGIALACGFVLMPFLIWLVGNRVLGPYTHGQDTTAGTGPLRLLADYFGGLTHGSLIFWCVALGPYLLLWVLRLLYGLVRSSPATST